jgi:hypothetical protein
MKKTVFDAKLWILDLLLLGGIKTTINGGVYIDRRPTNSAKEDIVINNLTMTNDFFQDGVFNVNCYVPYLSVTINGISQFMPNTQRMNVITKAVYLILEEQYSGDFNLAIVNHNTFEEDTEKSNFINFRINLKAFN